MSLSGAALAVACLALALQVVGAVPFFVKASTMKAQATKPKTTYLEAPVSATPNRVPQEDWKTFLRENLAPDIAPWALRAPLDPADIPRQHAAIRNGTLAGYAMVFQLILIYNNRIYFPNRTDVNNTEPPEPACHHGVAFYRKVSAMLASGRRRLPNALFVYSFEDNRPRFCSPTSEYCNRVPLLSQIKTMGQEGGDDLDILVPQWFYTPSSLYIFPWHLKKDVAFFRGEPFCSSFWVGRYRCHDACPRTGLAQLSAMDKLAGRPQVLDVGMVEPVERPKSPDGKPIPFRCLQTDIPLAKRTPIAEHSYYKWLLHMEGITASSRLSQLMLVNSVILFQRQPFIEYFYRSLRPNVHYVPFWNSSDGAGMDDVYNVVRGLQLTDMVDPDWVQGIVRAAQGFALKFTLPGSRFQYLKDALTAYRELFPAMDDYLETYVEGLRKRGFHIK